MDSNKVSPKKMEHIMSLTKLHMEMTDQLVLTALYHEQQEI